MILRPVAIATAAFVAAGFLLFGLAWTNSTVQAACYAGPLTWICGPGDAT